MKNFDQVRAEMLNVQQDIAYPAVVWRENDHFCKLHAVEYSGFYNIMCFLDRPQLLISIEYGEWTLAWSRTGFEVLSA